MEIRQLNTFIRVAQFQSFSKAAESLGYSQSAVTVQIRLLEEELNARLFDRMGKHVALTVQGQRFLSGAYDVLYEANRAKLSVSDEEELRGQLHIGAIDSLCFSTLPPVLHRFRVDYPRVAIQITTGSPEELIEKMEQGELDLIYILDEPRYNNNWYKLMEKKEEVVFVASADLRQELGGIRDLQVEQLLDKPFFLTEREANYHRVLDRYLATQNKVLTPFLEISDVSFIIKMLETTRGLSFLPWFAVEESVRQGRLSVLDVTDLHVSMYRQIFYHKAKWKTREMDEFARLAAMDLKPNQDAKSVPLSHGKYYI